MLMRLIVPAEHRATVDSINVIAVVASNRMVFPTLFTSIEDLNRNFRHSYLLTSSSSLGNGRGEEVAWPWRIRARGGGGSSSTPFQVGIRGRCLAATGLPVCVVLAGEFAEGHQIERSSNRRTVKSKDHQIEGVQI